MHETNREVHTIIRSFTIKKINSGTQRETAYKGRGTERVKPRTHYASFAVMQHLLMHESPKYDARALYSCIFFNPPRVDF